MSTDETPRCKFVATDQPRVLPGRHVTDCAGETCAGCLPCGEPHCVVCRREHAAVTCAECIASSRADLRQIAAMCDALPAEVEHRGINGEAMMLLGPSCNPEAARNVAMSAIMGRLPSWYLEDNRDEQHPLFVLGGWDQVWRDHLDMPTELAATLPRLVDYLDAKMHIMAAEPEVPFEDFARDLRGCRGHLEDVLHDQNQGDRANVDCFDCGGKLERRLTDHGFEDHWTCRRCRRRYTYAEYNFALRAALEESA